MRVYGADKVYKQMRRERITVACCTVEHVMKHLGLQGVRRGKVVCTTIGDMTAAGTLNMLLVRRKVGQSPVTCLDPATKSGVSIFL